MWLIRLWLLIVFPCTLLNAQADSTNFKNAMTIELFGNGAFNAKVPVHVGYHRFFSIKNNLTGQIKIGYGVHKRYLYDAWNNISGKAFIHTVPIEAGILVGEKALRIDLAIGYTAQFGDQSITTNLATCQSCGTTTKEEVSYYDFFTARIGVAYLPKRHFPYIRLAVMPVLIPERNPIYDRQVHYFSKHFVPLYGGLMIGTKF